MARQIRIWAALTGVLALLGLPAGLLWAWLSPRPHYIVVDKAAHLLDAENEVLIGADGRFALICAALGVAAGGFAYWRAGRGGELALVLGLLTGGAAGSLVAWGLGHRFGLAHFDHVVATAADGARVRGPIGLHATAVLTLWPLLALIVYGVLEAMDAGRRLTPPDRGDQGPGEEYQIGGSEFDLEPAPPGRDIDRRES